MSLKDRELRKEFIKETRTNAKELELCISKLNRSPNDEDIKEIAHRICHTLEGDALLARRYDIAYFANKIVRLIDANELTYTSDLIKSIKRALKEVKEGTKKEKTPDYSPLLKKLKQTEEKKIEADELVKESEKKFKSLVSNVPGAIYRRIHNKYMTMLFVSGNIKKISGYSAQEIIDNKKRSYISIIHPNDKKNITTQLKKQTLCKNKEEEYRIISKKGKSIWIKDINQCVEKTKEGCIVEGILYDITKEKEYEKKIELQAEVTKNLAEGVYIIGLKDG